MTDDNVTSPGKPFEGTGNAALAGWYGFAATQPGFIGHALTLLREREAKTADEQMRELKVDTQDFLHLQGIRVPRDDHFTEDVFRIAAHCRVGSPADLAHALNLSRQLAIADATGGTSHMSDYYEAAYDADGTLDKPVDPGD